MHDFGPIYPRFVAIKCHKLLLDECNIFRAPGAAEIASCGSLAVLASELDLQPAYEERGLGAVIRSGGKIRRGLENAGPFCDQADRIKPSYSSRNSDAGSTLVTNR